MVLENCFAARLKLMDSAAMSSATDLTDVGAQAASMRGAPLLPGSVASDSAAAQNAEASAVTPGLQAAAPRSLATAPPKVALSQPRSQPPGHAEGSAAYTPRPEQASTASIDAPTANHRGLRPVVLAPDLISKFLEVSACSQVCVQLIHLKVCYGNCLT